MRYEDYISIELPWLRSIPSHWSVLRNKNIFTEMKAEVGERSADYTLLSLTLNGIIPRDVESGKGKFPEKFDKYKIVKPGYMAFCLFDIDETPRTVGLSSFDGMLTGAYTIMSIDNINARYVLYYYLSLDCAKALKPLYTGLRKTININTFQSTKIPVPPRAEQDQIVRYLDWQVSKINKLIAAKKNEIAKIVCLKDRVLAEVFSLGLNYCGDYISDEYWIEKYPATWQNIKLSRILSVPMTDGPHETPQFVDGGIPFVSAEASHHGKIHLSQCRGYITPETHELYCQKIKPQRDDVFVVKSGSTTGKTVIVDFDDDFSIWSPLALIRCNNRAIPKYIFYFCTSRYFQQQVHDNWSFGTQPNIGMSELEKLRVLLPSIEEQHLIVSYLDEKFGQMDDLTCALEKQIDILHELRTRIISDVVTGQIDVRNIEVPDFEIVEEVEENEDTTDESAESSEVTDE